MLERRASSLQGGNHASKLVKVSATGFYDSTGVMESLVDEGELPVCEDLTVVARRRGFSFPIQANHLKNSQIERGTR